MSCTQALLSRILPRRARQTPGGDLPHPAPSTFVVHAVRLVDPSTSAYQSQIHDLRFQEQYPFRSAPDFEGMASHRHKRPKLDESESKKEQCRICYNEIDSPFLTPCRTCRQPYCNDCIKKQFEMALKSKEDMPVRCCRRVFYPGVAQGILSPVDLAIYKERFDESNTPNPFYCPVPTCSKFIPPRNLKPIRGKVICSLCNTMSCIKCKQVADPVNHSCTKKSDEDEILKKFGYKRCPKCSSAIMKMYGCAHVRCSGCAAHFCYDCLRPINICSVKPCVRARDDGEGSELDDGDALSDEEDGDDLEPTAVVRQSTSSELDLTEELADAQRTELARSSPPPLTASGMMLSMIGPAEPAEPADTADAAEPAGTPESDNIDVTASPMTLEAQPVSTAALGIANLDDPHRPDVDWENPDVFNFGEEPTTDDDWDIWGCLHRFNIMESTRIPDNWLIGLDKSRTVELECMGCFRDLKIFPAKTLDKSEGKVAPGSAPVNTVGSSENRGVTTSATATNTAPRDEHKIIDVNIAKEGKKKAVFDCSHCGVLFCWWCRRLALRRAEKFRQDTGIRTGST